MEPVYTQNYEIKDNMVDCFGNLRPGQILFIAQDMGTRHCQELSLSYDVLASHRLFWAVTCGDLGHAHHPGRLPQKRCGL